MATDRKEPESFEDTVPARGIDVRDRLDEPVLAWPHAQAAALAAELEALDVGVLIRRRAGDLGASVVEPVVSLLERATIDSVPAWLPDAAAFAGNPELARAGACAAAASLARELGLNPALVRAAIDAARGDRAGFDHLRMPDRDRLPQFAALLARAQGVTGIVILLEFEPPDSVTDLNGIEFGIRWVGGTGGLAVWACGPGCQAFNSIPRVGNAAGRRPDWRADSLPASSGPSHASMTPFVGMPHPWSAAEQRLENALRHVDWALDRRWNCPWRASGVDAVYLLDLLFQRANCVVEIDGREHREARKFQDDRRRDRILQSHGLRVLRFTNHEVMSDVEAVVAEIGIHVRVAVSSSEWSLR